MKRKVLRIVIVHSQRMKKVLCIVIVHQRMKRKDIVRVQKIMRLLGSSDTEDRITAAAAARTTAGIW